MYEDETGIILCHYCEDPAVIELQVLAICISVMMKSAPKLVYLITWAKNQ